MVGNVIVGGAGKTPLVIELVDHLQKQGLKVGVVSRGAGRKIASCIEVGPATPVFESGDEPALIKQATGAPFFVAKKRAQAALALVQKYPETQILICDDGLQHYALGRDLEIVVFDNRGIGNGWLLPAGPLRENWLPRRNHPTDLILHTGSMPAFEGFRSTRRLASHAVAADGTKVDLSSLRGTGLTALAGIAKPESFFDMLKARDLKLNRMIALPDHFDPDDFELGIAAGSTILCTQKDAVKLYGHWTMSSYRVLGVPLIFEPEPAFLDAFDASVRHMLSELPSHHGHKTP